MRWLQSLLITLLVITWYSFLPSTDAGKPDCGGSPGGCGHVKEDVDECALDPGICGNPLAICKNMRRGFHCECPDGYLPSPGINWKINVTVCKGQRKALSKTKSTRGPNPFFVAFKNILLSMFVNIL